MAGFSMDLADLDEVKEKEAEAVAPAPEVKVKLEKVADSNTKNLMTFDLDSLEERRDIITSIDTFGQDIVEKSTQKNDMLNVRLVDLSKMGGENGAVVNGLAELSTQMKDLDPSGIDFTKKGVFGKLFSPARNYFTKYERADAIIAKTMDSLAEGKAVLKNDNTTLEIEQMSLRDLTKKLNQQIEMGTQMDESISAAIEKAKVENVDEERIKFIEEEVLFPLRQKIMDMQQMPALKIAVTVASALYNQKLVLEKVNAVNEATNKLIGATSKMLKDQGASIQQQAMQASISVDTLKDAFANTFDALDAVSSYKSKALPQMKNSIEQFRALADEGEKRIQKMEASEERRKQLMAEGGDPIKNLNG